MILLDTHIWVWWVQDDPRLKAPYRALIRTYEARKVGVHVISCLEIARLVAGGRVILPRPLQEWIDKALSYPGVELVPLTPRIAVHSTELPGEIHRDPADRILVAAARLYDCALVTLDEKLLAYPHVKHLTPDLV